jgi:hypothetical protein
VQTAITEPDAIWRAIPDAARAAMTAHRVQLWALDTAGLARRYAPRPELEVRMQGVALAGVFLRVAPFGARAGLSTEALMDGVRQQLARFFGKRGKTVIDANLALIHDAYDNVIDVTSAIRHRAIAGELTGEAVRS